MHFNLNTYLNILSLTAMAVVAFYVVRSKVKDENLNDLKERVAILEKEREEARTQHIENQKAIANLEGQLKTYKEIPLKAIAASLSELSQSNGQILSVLQGSALIAANDRDILGSKQTVKEMTVEHQTIKK